MTAIIDIMARYLPLTMALSMFAGSCAGATMPAESINSSICLSDKQLATMMASANKGDLIATRRLAAHYAACSENKKLELKYREEAAQIGTAFDLKSLAATLELTEGVDAAFPVYLHAAESGDIYSEYWVGSAYRDGNGVSKDTDEATHWLELAARRGGYSALIDLATLLAADGKLSSRQKSTALFLIAKRDGKLPADKVAYIDDIVSHLSPDEMASVKTLMEDYSSDLP